MTELADPQPSEAEARETREWLDSLDDVLHDGGPTRVGRLLQELGRHAIRSGVALPFSANTPYINTIDVGEQPPFPGDSETERRIKSFVRWNALAMVVRANRIAPGIGGHISTYASAATLYEVAFNHFFRARRGDAEGDIVYFQGHAAPGIYARAFLEGRLDVEQLENFRRELKPGGGLSSYPHPWLMPDFWEYPTVSMGLSPIMAIYQAGRRDGRVREAGRPGRCRPVLRRGRAGWPTRHGAVSRLQRVNDPGPVGTGRLQVVPPPNVEERYLASKKKMAPGGRG